MTWVAVAVGAGSIVTGYLGSQSAKKAGSAAQKGADQSIAESQRQFDLVRGDTAGQRFIGNGATNTLARLYGYGTPPSYGAGTDALAGATPYQAQPIATSIPGGKFNIGGNLLGNSTLSKIHDPFASRHGDENRNLKAFAAESGVMELSNGMLMLPDGSTFSPDRLKDVAGTWYGAVHAPDGNQEDWQQRYSTLLGGLSKIPVAQGNAGGGLTSDGVPNSAPMQVGAGQPGKPDMSAFFESPDYQFNVEQTLKGVDRGQSAGGRYQSGGGQREVARYASGLASREFGGFVDRLMQQAGLGSTGIGASAAAGANAASNIGNAYMNAGNAQAGAYMQQGQAVNNAVQGGIQNYLLYNYLNKPNAGVGNQATNYGYGKPFGSYG